MADVQPEHGTVRIANDLFDAIAAADLTRVELLCLMAALRQSWGFGRKSTGDWCSLSFVQKYTGLKRSDCSRGMKGLVQKQLLRKEDGGFTQAAEYRPVKDYDQWSPGVLPAAFRPIGGPCSDTSDDSGTSPRLVTSDDSGNATSPRSGTTQETSNNQDNNNPPKPPRGRRSKAVHKDAPALLDHFKAEFKRWAGKDSRKTLGWMSKVAGPRLDEHGLDACKEVVTWAFRSPTAEHLRSGGYLVKDTLWRPSKFEGYLDAAALPTASFPSNDTFEVPKSPQYIPFANGRNVRRDPDGLWKLSELNLLDKELPWYSVVAEVMQGFIDRQAMGERVDRHVPAPYIAALANCSHPAAPEQPHYVNNVLGRVIGRLEEGWQG